MPAGIAFVARTGIAGGSERLARAMVEKVKPRIVAAAEATGEAATEKVLEIIEATYGERQGKARSEPLATAGNYTHQVDQTPRGVTLIFKVEGSDAFMKKFGALNYGAGPHVIAPSGRALANKQDRSRGPRGFFSRTPVMWSTSSGKFGTQFWQRGCRAALDGFTERL